MILIIKTPSKVKSNPLGITSKPLRVFFKQKITKELFEKAIITKHILLCQ